MALEFARVTSSRLDTLESENAKLKEEIECCNARFFGFVNSMVAQAHTAGDELTHEEMMEVVKEAVEMSKISDGWDGN